MTDFLQKKRSEIAARMRELKPSVEEYTELEAASAALAGLGSDGSSSAPRRTRATNGRRRGRGRPATRKSATRKSRTRASTAGGASTAGTGTASAATAGGGRSATRRRATKTGGRRGRPRGSGTRAAQALELVKGQPGITIPELAKRMGIKQNYLYRVLPGLQADGRVRKQGRGWHAKSA